MNLMMTRFPDYQSHLMLPNMVPMASATSEQEAAQNTNAVELPTTMALTCICFLDCGPLSALNDRDCEVHRPSGLRTIVVLTECDRKVLHLIDGLWTTVVAIDLERDLPGPSCPTALPGLCAGSSASAVSAACGCCSLLSWTVGLGPRP